MKDNRLELKPTDRPEIERLLLERYYFEIPEEVISQLEDDGVNITYLNWEGKYYEDWRMLCKRVAFKLATGYFNLVKDKREKDLEISDIIRNSKEGYYDTFIEFKNSFFDIMYNLHALPSSPILFNAMRGYNDKYLLYKNLLKNDEDINLEELREITKFENNKSCYGSCYSMGVIEDSVEDIYSALLEQAQIFKSAGGYGVNFSKLRSKEAPVRSIEGNSTGACSFIDMFHHNTNIISLHSKTKRGANMWIMDSKHPEIIDFVDAKRNGEKWTKGNVSVWIDDEFMKALAEQKGYTLQDPTFPNIQKQIPASFLWEKIVKNSVETAEPGILFSGNIEERNMFKGIEKINSVNPCAEYINVDETVCTLGSVNYFQIYYDSMGEEKYNFDAKLESVTNTLGLLLTCSIWANTYPLEKLTKKSRELAPIGVGYMGYASLLNYLNIPYGSDEAVDLLGHLNFLQLHSLIGMSGWLGEKFGSFKGWKDTENYKNKNWYGQESRKLPEEMFNSRLLSIAPTGSISFICNVSSGIEPIFFKEYTRTINKGMDNEYDVVMKDESLFQKEFHPTYELKTAQELSIIEHLYPLIYSSDVIDMGISKTFNINPDRINLNDFKEEVEDFMNNRQNINYLISPEKYKYWIEEGKFFELMNGLQNYFNDGEQIVHILYLLIYIFGIRGATIYVEGSRDGIVKSATETKGGERDNQDEFSLLNSIAKEEMEKIVKENEEKHKIKKQKVFYKIVDRIEYTEEETGKEVKINVEVSVDGEEKKPFEIYFLTKDPDLKGYCEIIGRLISFLLRNNVPVEIPLKQLSKVSNGNTALFKHLINSIVKLLKITGKENTFEEAKRISLKEENLTLHQKGYYLTKDGKKICPSCLGDNKEGNVVVEDGCISCYECGWGGCSV